VSPQEPIRPKAFPPAKKPSLPGGAGEEPTLDEAAAGCFSGTPFVLRIREPVGGARRVFMQAARGSWRTPMEGKRKAQARIRIF
jgi:hypothetical protein